MSSSSLLDRATDPNLSKTKAHNDAKAKKVRAAGPNSFAERLYGEASLNPYLLSDRRGRTYFAWVLAFFVTVGNALNNAGQALFSIARVLAEPFAIISAAGTFTAMVELYGKEVFPKFEGALTTSEQREEYTAFVTDIMHAKKNLELDNDKDLIDFLAMCYQERYEMHCRREFRGFLAEAVDRHSKIDISHWEMLARGKATHITDTFTGPLSEYLTLVEEATHSASEVKSTPPLRQPSSQHEETLKERELPPTSNIEGIFTPRARMEPPFPKPFLGSSDDSSILLRPHNSSAISAIDVKPQKAEIKNPISLFQVDIATLHILANTKSTKGSPLLKAGVDLRSAFDDVSAYQQWLWTLLREEKITLSKTTNKVGNQVEFASLRDKKEDVSRRARLKMMLGGILNKATKQQRDAALAKEKEGSATDDDLEISLMGGTINVDKNALAAIDRWQKMILSVGQAAIEHDEKEIDRLFPIDGNPKTIEKRKRLRQYLWLIAKAAYNKSFQTVTERHFAIAGQIIGFLGAVGNAALGYVGLMALIGLMGLGSIPAAAISILVLGMLTGFGSSFWMTRYAIIARLEDFGRYLSKGLPIENPELRYFSVVFGLLGSVGPAYFAYIAGEMLMLSLLGTSPAALVGVFVFALICGVATFFGAGALMVEGLYKAIEPYVQMIDDHIKANKHITAADEKRSLRYKRIGMVIRMFFIGELRDKRTKDVVPSDWSHSEYTALMIANPGSAELRTKRELTDWEHFAKDLQLFLGRWLGLILLIGAVASQIMLGVTPFIIITSSLAAIGMFAMYGGVFEVSKKLVDVLVRGVQHLYQQPSLLLFGLAAGVTLELSITSAIALATQATVAGISAAVAPSLFVFALLPLLVLAMVVYRHISSELANKATQPEMDTLEEEETSKPNPAASTGFDQAPSPPPSPIAHHRPSTVSGSDEAAADGTTATSRTPLVTIT